MAGLPVHKDREVQEALVRLTDALCMWERDTGRQSVLILREDDFVCRALSGKCTVDEDISDQHLLMMNGYGKRCIGCKRILPE